jgi:hypothetical protein
MTRTPAQRRLKGLRLHLIGYFAVCAILVAINLSVDPARVWFAWPMVGWGPVLAFHVAYVMGLFGGSASSGSRS